MLEFWNIGKMGFGLRLVEPMARRGYWSGGLMAIIGIVNLGAEANPEQIISKD